MWNKKGYTMRRRGDKIIYDQNLRVGVNKVNFSQHRDTTTRCQLLYGFTLIELLVVISIIALLLSILMPSLNAVRESAKKVTCASNLRTLGQACIGYGTENRNNLPGPTNYVYPHMDNYDSTASDMWANSGIFYNQIFSYLANTKPLYCPSQKLWTHRMANTSPSPLYYKYVYNYFYWGGVRFHSNGIYEVKSITGKAELRSISTRLTDKGSWLLAQDMAVDVTRSVIFTSDITNHMGKKSGTNCLYMDSHVTWLDKSRLNYKPFNTLLLPGETPNRGVPITPWP